MHYKYNGVKFNRNRTINWKRIWEKFDNLVSNEDLENMGLFKEWSGKYGQSALLRTILAGYVIANDTEWKKFNRKFQNWYNGAHWHLSPVGDWSAQQRWVEDYFKSIDVT